MDNKFVHIDHLFKDGLSGGEEQEPSGSWLQMKDLLDKEMPIGGGAARVAQRPFKRYWMPALLLLLVTSAGGSYYWLNHKAIADEQGAGSIATVSRSKAGGRGNIAPSESFNGNNISRSNKITNEGSVKQNAGGNNNSEVVASIKANNNSDRHNIAHNKAGHTPNNNGNNNAGKIPVAVEKQQKSANHMLAAGNNNELMTASAATGNRNNKANKTKGKIKSDKLHNNKSNNQALALNSKSSSGNKEKEVNPFTEKAIKATQKELKVMADNNNLVALQDGGIVKKSEQEITRLAVTESPVYGSTNGRNRGPIGYRLDTTSVSRKKEIFYEELTPLEVAAISKMNVIIEMNNVVPMASSVRFANGERGVKLMALSDFKVKSKKTAPEKINEMIGNTTNGIASLFDGTRKYYAALLLGGNASIGNPSAFGLQLGIAGFYALSERWTLGAELKYFNRHFSNYKLSDLFTTYEYGTPVITGSEFEYSYQEKSSGQYYKVQNFATLEMPVLLNYNLGRVSLFGGPNMAYAFAMHPVIATEINSTSKTLTTSTAKFPLASQSAKVVSDDFKSRFGLGYVFGMTYDLSRSFSLDARVAQTLWDNAASDMSKQLSNAVFRKPSIQFGLNIYFGRREKVTYILER